MTDQLKNLVESSALTITSRIMASFGVPVAAFLFYQVWDGIKDVQKSVSAQNALLAVHETEIKAHDVRLSDLNARVQSMDDKMLYLFNHTAPLGALPGEIKK